MRILKIVFIAHLFLLSLYGEEINWVDTWNGALQKAKEENKLILLMVTQKHCGACEFMKLNTFSKESVIDEVNRYYIPIMLDISETPKGLRVRGTPTIRFYTPAGKKIRYKIVGGMGYKKFLSKIQRLRTLFYKTRK